VTLGFGEIVPQFVRNADNVFGFDSDARHLRDHPIDSLGFGVVGCQARPARELPPVARSGRSGTSGRPVVILLITVFCSVRLRDSRLGRAWIAIREDETAAAAMGIPLMRTKTWRYAIGAFFGGVAGAFYAASRRALPGGLLLQHLVFLLCMVILGGMGSVWGVILGAMILGYLDPRGTGDDRLQDPGRGPRVRPDDSTSSGSTGSSSWR
jgi:branched-chain amino acid transport system permease protein